MKKRSLFSLTLLLITVLFAQESLAQNYSRWGLPEGAILRLGRGALDGFAFTPDGQWLTISSSVGLWYYDVATGAMAALRVEGLPPFTGVVSPDTSLFTSMRWMTFELGLDVLSRDGATLVSATGDTIRVRDTATGEIRFEERLGTRIRAVAYWSDPFALVAASGDTILVWREGEGGVKTPSILRGHADEVRALTILPDGATLASASIARNEEDSYFGSGEIRLWDLASDHAEVTRTFIIPEYTCCLDWGNMAFSLDGSTLAAGGYETVFLWDVTTGQLAGRLEDDDLSGNTVAVTFSPDGQTVASRVNTLGNHIRLWDIATGAFRDIGSEEHMSLTPMAFSSDGSSMLATRSRWSASTSYEGWRYWDHADTKILYWDTRTGQLKNEMPSFSHSGWAGGMTPVRRSPDFKTLAVGITSVEKGGATSGWVELYNIVTGRSISLSHEAGIDSVAFSPDGDILVSYMQSETADAKHYDETIRLWDIATGELLLAASEDTVVTLQHPTTRQAIATVSRGSVAFDGDGSASDFPPDHGHNRRGHYMGVS